MGNKTKIGIIFEMIGLILYVLGALAIIIGVLAVWGSASDAADSGDKLALADAVVFFVTMLLVFCGALVLGFISILVGLIMQVVTAKEFDNHTMAIAGLVGFVLGFILSIIGQFASPVLGAVGSIIAFVSLGLPLLKIGGKMPAIIGMAVGAICSIISLVLSLGADITSPEEAMNFIYAQLALGAGNLIGYGLFAVACIMALKWTAEHYKKGGAAQAAPGPMPGQPGQPPQAAPGSYEAMYGTPPPQ